MAPIETTLDETEAFQLGRSRNYAAKITRHERAPRERRRQSQVRLLWHALVFHCNVVTCPRVDNLTSAKHVPRFSLWQMDGRSLNGLLFPYLNR
jgi:hypothetical protein